MNRRVLRANDRSSAYIHLSEAFGPNFGGGSVAEMSRKQADQQGRVFLAFGKEMGIFDFASSGGQERFVFEFYDYRGFYQKTPVIETRDCLRSRNEKISDFIYQLEQMP